LPSCQVIIFVLFYLIILSKAKIALLIKFNNNNNNNKLIKSNTNFIKNVLNFEFLNCIHLFLIITFIKLKVKTRFCFISIVVYFIKQYAF